MSKTNKMQDTLINVILYSIIPTLITLYFTEKLEGIKKEHSMELSKFQAEINALKSKENFKFTKLHEKRFSVLEKVYQLLNNTLAELNCYISPVKSTPNGMTLDEHEDNLQLNFINAHNEFALFYSDSKIYLDENIASLVDNYLNEIGQAYVDYSQNHILRKFGDRQDPATHRTAYTAYKKIPKKIIPIKKQIEDSFRELLER